jgi:hypothetical protein
MATFFSFRRLVQVPSNLVSKLLRISVFVRDRMTGDTLPVTVTSSQPAPLELLSGTTTFNEGGCLIPVTIARHSAIDIPCRSSDCGTCECAIGRERVLRCGDHGCVNSRAAVMVLLAVARAIRVTRRISHVAGAACPYSKKTRYNSGLPKDLGHPPRNLSKKSLKQVTIGI